MAYQQGLTPTTGEGAMAPGTSSEEQQQKLAKGINEEYHDPYDSWSSKNILLSLIPFIVTYAFKDVNLRAALAFATAFSAFLIIQRTVAYSSRWKTIWPAIDIVSLIAFPILLGMTYINHYRMTQWINVILPAIFAFTFLLTILFRKPASAHYARYPKFDRGGSAIWHGDKSYRRTSDLVSLGWFAAFAAMCCLSLAPILTGRWGLYTALNVIFNYAVPAALLWAALIFQQLMGKWYRSSTTKHAAPGYGGGRGAGYPASLPAGGTTTAGTGMQPAGTPTYSSAV